MAEIFGKIALVTFFYPPPQKKIYIYNSIIQFQYRISLIHAAAKIFLGDFFGRAIMIFGRPTLLNLVISLECERARAQIVHQPLYMEGRVHIEENFKPNNS